MIIKKFQAKTEKEAILNAKAELGKDAIVTNIKTIKPRGVYKLLRAPVVEITAAVDDAVNYEEDNLLSSFQRLLNNKKDESNQQPNEERQIGGEYESVSHVTTEKKNDVYLESDREMDTSEIEKRLNTLQDMIEKQSREKEQDSKKEEETSKNKEYCRLIYDQLVRNEVDEKFANQILQEIETTLQKEAPVDTILTSIYQKIVLKLGQPEVINLKEDSTKFVFFIGPTGVGKTTTIAKIASGFRMDKSTKIALVTSDTYRIAAVEQLRIYANILSVPLKVIYSKEELEQSMNELKQYDIVLIDTAGRSHKNEEQQNDLKQLLNVIDESSREVYLVVSATTKYKDLLRITETYSAITGYKVIFTKLDETISLGNILNIKMLTGATLSYATWGQNVPNDIGRLDTQFVAKKLLGGSD